MAATKIDGLQCVCGGTAVYYDMVGVDSLMVNQLYCPECGIIMRSPPSDKDGAWLKEHWRTVHMGDGYKRMQCKDCMWWEYRWQCTNPESAYFGCECSSVFGCDSWMSKGDNNNG